MCVRWQVGSGAGRLAGYGSAEGGRPLRGQLLLGQGFRVIPGKPAVQGGLPLCDYLLPGEGPAMLRHARQSCWAGGGRASRRCVPAVLATRCCMMVGEWVLGVLWVFFVNFMPQVQSNSKNCRFTAEDTGANTG